MTITYNITHQWYQNQWFRVIDPITITQKMGHHTPEEKYII